MSRRIMITLNDKNYEFLKSIDGVNSSTIRKIIDYRYQEINEQKSLNRLNQLIDDLIVDKSYKVQKQINDKELAELGASLEQK